MTDPIDRAAAYEVLSDYYHHRTEFQHMALRDALSRVPSVQPEIIRCKDCDNWQRIKSPTKRGSCAEFSDAENGMTRYTSENDFCSYAERRTDE